MPNLIEHLNDVRRLYAIEAMQETRQNQALEKLHKKSQTERRKQNDREKNFY